MFWIFIYVLFKGWEKLIFLLLELIFLDVGIGFFNILELIFYIWELIFLYVGIDFFRFFIDFFVLRVVYDVIVNKGWNFDKYFMFRIFKKGIYKIFLFYKLWILNEVVCIIKVN